LTLLDFSFKGFVTDTVYHEKVQNVNELWDRIITAELHGVRKKLWGPVFENAISPIYFMVEQDSMSYLQTT
jgi:hypothetical protein